MNDIRITSWDRESCPFPRRARFSRPEADVVLRVIENLIAMGYPGEAIQSEFRLSPRSRPDVVVQTARTVVIFECKAVCVMPKDLAQAVRYRDEARDRWPDRQVAVFLVAPAVHPGIAALDGIDTVAL